MVISTDLNKALNQVLKLLQADPEYHSELAVQVNFYLGPGLITVNPRTDKDIAQGEEEIIALHALGQNAAGQEVKYQR
jgi:hypothetical protein